MPSLNVFLADDHAVVREGLKRLIDAESDMKVIGEAEDGAELLLKAGRLCPDVVVIDISMGDMNGAEATRRLCKDSPATKILALTVHEDTSYVRELLEAGAAGYILKRAAADELIRAIRFVSAGGIYVDPRVAGKLVGTLARPRTTSQKSLSQLSERETSVLRLIAQGYTNKEIAGQLAVSVKTVETYKARSMEKLGLRSRVDIVRTAMTRGWLPAV